MNCELSSKEVADFMAASHDALVGLIPFNPEISKTDEWNGDTFYDDKNSESP